METETIAVLGSRTFSDFDLMKKVLDCEGKFILVSGGAEGADSLAERYADGKGYEKTIFAPDYETYGNAAPLIRNEKIIDECDKIIAFMVGETPGTMGALALARKKNKPAQVIRVVGETNAQ